jgi:hypothetical protein
MLTPYSTTTPRDTDYISAIYAELRLVKKLFEERYILDHRMNVDDTADTDAHNKLTMAGITVDMYEDQKPYVMNYGTMVAELPANGTILFVKKVGGANRLCYACKDKTNVLKEIILR